MPSSTPTRLAADRARRLAQIAGAARPTIPAHATISRGGAPFAGGRATAGGHLDDPVRERRRRGVTLAAPTGREGNASPKPLRRRLIVDLFNRGVSVAGIGAREGLGAKRSRPEMAPQRLEKIESALGNGSVSETSKPQDVVQGRAAHRALRLKKSGAAWEFTVKIFLPASS